MATNIDIAEELRLELKTWEKNFRVDHGGRKPSREEIRRNADIHAKYRKYNHICRPSAPKEAVSSTSTPGGGPTSTPRKASSTKGVPQEPLQDRPRNAPTSTPRKTSKPPTHIPALSPVKEEEQPTPAFIRSALGPTPQKDGHVLGIFDYLSTGTPSKPSPTADPNADTVAATPSKTASGAFEGSATSRTPQSSSKRFYLDAFAGTPLKRKRHDHDIGSPSSSAKKMDATPSFLRRSFPVAAIEEGSFPATRPFKRPPIRKSLSSVIRSMKAQEEQRVQEVEKRMDDDWDVMNELEAEERGEAPPFRTRAKATVQVEDSQPVDTEGDMPLGPDQGPALSEDEEAAPLGRDGQPRKPWKKRGLKRQTRRVNMKPVLHQPGKAPEAEAVEEEDAVGERQLEPRKNRAAKQRRTTPIKGDEDEGADSGSNYGDIVLAGDNSDEDEAPPSPSKSRKVPTKVEENEKDGILKRTGKKVAATANANFRRLNIKNKNSKAKGRGRFGKR